MKRYICVTGSEMNYNSSSQKSCMRSVSCFAVVWCRSSQFYPYAAGLVHCHQGHHTIPVMPVNQIWKIWNHTSPLRIHDISKQNKNMHISWGKLYSIFRFLAAMIYIVNRSLHCEGVLNEWCDMTLPWHHLNNGLPWQQETTAISENKTQGYVGTFDAYQSVMRRVLRRDTTVY